MRHAAIALLCLAGCDSAPATDDAGPADASVVADLTATCLPGPPDGAVAFPDPNCPILKPKSPDSLDEALTLAGLDRCSLGFSKQDWSIFGNSIREDLWRLPWYDAVHDHAVRAPAFGRALVADLDAAARSKTPVADALTVAGTGLGVDLAPCIAPPAIDPAQPLARAVARVIADYGGTPDVAALEADAADVPAELQIALARVILAAGDANRAWLDLAAPLAPEDLDALSTVHALAIPSSSGTPDIANGKVKDLLAHRFDEPALVEGAVRLAWSIETADLARFANQSGFSFDQDTPLGRVVLHDAHADTYAGDSGPYLVVVDTGGDDTWRAPAGAIDAIDDPAGPRHVSIAIDLAGQDTYAYDEVPSNLDGKRLVSDAAGRYRPRSTPDKDNGPFSLSETPRQGAARLGYGMLFDIGSEADHYRSLRMSQGFASAGVGVLYDAGGDDRYEVEAAAQGAALFGVGLLLDEAGNDTYKTYTMSQGFAYVRGVGILYDTAGADQYLADNGDPMAGGDPLYLTPQLPGKGNSSFTQGAGFGRRAPCSGGNTDCVYMSGGLGLLRDLAGADTYMTSVFGQGTGYWFGTGILADGAGDDTYDGKWYVQGSAAHFALCLFLEDGGNDKYNPTLVPAATSIGVGHDFSVSWHIDSGGNDIYRAPGLSLGSGNTNGVGVLVNLGGDDEYHAPGEPTLGCGNPSG
jgi:hypothetical protein